MFPWTLISIEDQAEQGGAAVTKRREHYAHGELTDEEFEELERRLQEP